MRTDQELIRMWNRYAPAYFNKILSPFAIGPSFPLYNDVKELIEDWSSKRNQSGMIALDCGCGIGKGLELLAGKVQFAVGIDWSEGMISEARNSIETSGLSVDSFKNAEDVSERLKNKKNKPNQSLLLQCDLRNISALNNTADLALSINSVISPTLTDSKAALISIANTLKSGGKFISVLPSSDVMPYACGLHLLHGHFRDAWKIRWRKSGVYYAQKYFNPKEITSLLEKDCGIQIIKLEKLYYPWKLIDKLERGYYPKWEETWDWYVLGEKI